MNQVFLLALVAGCGSGGDASTPEEATAENTRSFVVSSFGYEYPVHEGNPCPGGFNLSLSQMRAAGLPPLADDCSDPEANTDPTFKTLTAPGRIDGFDLDGVVSTKGLPQSGECAHDDFAGLAGEAGFDLQLWRAVGCVRGFQKGEIADFVIAAAVKDGSMTILLEIEGVDDEREDDSVRVRLFGSAEAPAVGADGSVLPFGTLSVHPDSKYHGDAATGSIAGGILVAGPFDLQLRLNIQIVQSDMTLRKAWIRAELLPDGTAQGWLFGYQPVEELYDIFGRQVDQAGAEALSYTCTGLYAALRSQADGDFDAATGTCSSLSLAYRFEAVPAFIAQ